MYFCERMCRESLCAKTDLYQKENRSGAMNEIGVLKGKLLLMMSVDSCMQNPGKPRQRMSIFYTKSEMRIIFSALHILTLIFPTNVW